MVDARMSCVGYLGEYERSRRTDIVRQDPSEHHDVSSVRDLGRMASDFVPVPYGVSQVQPGSDWVLLGGWRGGCHLWSIYRGAIG